MTLSVVMAGLVPAIHVFDYSCKKDVDARDERGHDESNIAQFGIITLIRIELGSETGRDGSKQPLEVGCRNITVGKISRLTACAA